MITIKRIPKDLRMRRGRVLIDAKIIDSHPEDILAVLAHFVVVRAEYLHAYPVVEYQGYCHLFEPVHECEEIPTYDFHLTRNWRGQVTTINVIKH